MKPPAREFTSILDDIPSGLPHPDGIQRIQTAARELAAARKKKERAHTRLDDYLSRRILPEDLKRRRVGRRESASSITPDS